MWTTPPFVFANSTVCECEEKLLLNVVLCTQIPIAGAQAKHESCELLKAENIKGFIYFHLCLDLGENLAPEMASNVFLN